MRLAPLSPWTPSGLSSPFKYRYIIDREIVLTRSWRPCPQTILSLYVQGESRYRGILGTGRAVLGEGGLSALYRGLLPSLIGTAPNAGDPVTDIHIFLAKVIHGYLQSCYRQDTLLQA